MWFFLLFQFRAQLLLSIRKFNECSWALYQLSTCAKNYNKWLGLVRGIVICPDNMVQVKQANRAQLKLLVRRIKLYQEVIHINHIQSIFESKETKEKQVIPTRLDEIHATHIILNTHKRNLFKS